MSETLSRKLVVILHADVVGSTALVQLNETLAHQRIRDTFQRFSETIATHGGIARELRGDALVAEFSKASDAVSAAVDFQNKNAAHNEALTDEVRPAVRIGIAMGEVVIADNTVTGEGVVLAQRLEQLADAGGVCLQGAAYETVPKRLPFEYVKLGEQTLKGFDEPVRAYGVSLKAGKSVLAPGIAKNVTKQALELPDKPSIAVLPFDNLSDDPEQDYFADGIVEDIITGLSKFRSLLVTARNSTFSYKGTSPNVQQVGKTLGVRYVVEGSVRRAGDRIRVTAQLIDALDGNHVWAERYDRQLVDLFDLQDEITGYIVSTLDR